MILLKSKLFRSKFADFGLIFAGCVLYAVGFSVFVESNSIAAGGATGVATIIHHFVDAFPIGFVIIILNLPLFILGFLKFKGGFLFKTIIATVLSSVLIDIFAEFLPIYSGDMILSSLAAGVTMGSGLALIMLRGATTGGTDIVAKLINKRFKFIPIGRLMLFVDAVIVIFAGIVYKSFETILYSVLFLFTLSVVIDKLLYGADHGKLVFIITKNSAEMLENITMTLGRGVTRINAYGGYTGEDIAVLMCAARSPEVSKLLSVVKVSDQNAFVVVTEAGEILGLGFRQINM